MTERPFLGVNGLSINMFFFNESDTCLNRPDASFQDSKFPLNKISGTSRSRIANCEELRIKYSNNKNIVYLRCVGIFVSGKCLTFLVYSIYRIESPYNAIIYWECVIYRHYSTVKRVLDIFSLSRSHFFLLAFLYNSFYLHNSSSHMTIMQMYQDISLTWRWFIRLPCTVCKHWYCEQQFESIRIMFEFRIASHRFDNRQS